MTNSLQLHMDKIYISPSLLSADFSAMGADARASEVMGADLLHCDVMDGNFVPNITFGMPMVKALSGCVKIPLDVHLMINKPERFSLEFIKSGAKILTFHPEASDNPEALLTEIRAQGVLCGIALNPNVEFTRFAHLLPLCDMVIVMGVYAGFGGQGFITDTPKKISELKAYRDKNGLKFSIEIDGGVTNKNIAEIKRAGANVIVSGSYLFKSDNMGEAIASLR